MDEIKAYTITELAKKDGISRMTIYRNTDKYIGVQFKNSKAKLQCKNGYQEKPYTVKYIRVEDVKKILDKKNLPEPKSLWQKLK